MSMNTISAARFKEQCLGLLDTVGPEGLVITKRGKPVARLLPMGGQPARLIGCLREKLRVRGDVLSTGVDWQADAQP